MSERGEITLVSSLIILCLSGMVLLSSLELQRSFKRMKARTTILLCTKETKGELKDLLTLMGRTNWGIKNLERVKLLSIFFPGAALSSKGSESVKKVLQKIQELRMVLHLKTIRDLHNKGCPLDPSILKSPFEVIGPVLKRDQAGGIILRRIKWNYRFALRPYEIHLNVKVLKWEGLSPHFQLLAEDRPVRPFYLLRAF